MERLGDCPRSPSDSQDLVANAKGCADKYALEAGFRRCASRAGAPYTRASWFVRDVPDFMASPEWYLFGTFCSMRTRKLRRVQAYRFAARPPRPESLKGSLRNEGLVYQFAPRASALVFLLVSALLAPTASYENRVATTEVISRAIDAREGMSTTGHMENWPSSQSESSDQPWSFNAALDSVVGTLLFGTAVNKPASRDMMAQFRLAGSAPETGGCHFAFPSDCCLWAPSDGMFVIGDAAP